MSSSSSLGDASSNASRLYRTGLLFALASAALFAIRPIFVKLVYAEQVDSTTLIALRMIFSAPFYFLLLLYFLRDPKHKTRITKSLVIKTIGAGLLGYYGASFMDLLGLQYLTAQLGRMILYSYPTFVVLFGALFFAQKLTARTLLALTLTYVGISIIFGHDLSYFGDDVITGSLFIIGSAILFSLYLLFSKKLITQLGSKVFTCIALLAASVGILLHFFITHTSADLSAVNNRALGYVLIIAIFCTVIPTFFTTAAVERIGADKTGIISMIGPAFTSVFAIALLGESFTIYHFLGISLTMLGVSLLRK